MFNQRITSVLNNQSTARVAPIANNIAIVYSVILDENHLQIKEGNSTIADIGSIECRMLASIQSSDLILARPLVSSITNLPVRNQSVQISKVGGDYFYEPISKGESPNVTSSDTVISELYPQTEQSDSTSKSSDYSNSQKTGIVKNKNSDLQKVDGYGDYFKSEAGIHRLKLYEGDTTLQSRFGQSIRFSGYNNSESEFAPTITIRNSESALSRDTDFTTTIVEDINRDGSIILLGSGKYIAPFQPGTLSEKGSTDFETQPISFKDFPSELKGDQIIMNSGRLILSSKNAEMIFYSKKNYGFISDATLSIDNKFGIEANVGDDINIKTNDRNINLNTGNGKVNIGDTNLESLVRGETLVNLMTELISAIEVMTHITPSGLSAPPLNVASFTKVKSSLKTMLSNLNKTS